MSDYSNGDLSGAPDSATPTIQSLARAGRARLSGNGWEAAKRISFLSFLVLIMLVPLSMVEGVIEERGWRKQDVAREIGEQWGPEQVISGPLLVVPYEHGTRTRYLVFTPELTEITAATKVEKRYKSIYEVPVYGAEILLTGRFASPDPATYGVAPAQVKWESASLVLGVSGIRAVRAATLEAAGTSRPIEAGLLPYHPFAAGIYAKLSLSTLPGATPRGFDFAVKLVLNGRDALSFQPLGRQTEIRLGSDWPHPGFVGSPLPAAREIRADGFTAQYAISHIATGAPLSWRTDEFRLDPARLISVGVALVEPGDVHQQTDRIVKYGVLVVGLTFGTIFVAGLLRRDRVHLVQYLLIGAALSLFYLLLLSLAEQMEFGLAYLIASLVDIAIVAWYAGATIRRVLGLAVGAILAALHGYMYVLLQMESYALLSGTIGLFVVLILVMYVTRKVDWFALGQEPKEAMA